MGRWGNPSVSKADALWHGANLLSLGDISLNKGIALYKGAKIKILYFGEK